MTNNKDKTNGINIPPFALTCIGILVMVLVSRQFKTDRPTVGKEVLAGFQTISDSETSSLVGLSTNDLRQRLGKPNDVKTSSNRSSSPRDLEGAAETPDESWIYYRKVEHEASGTKMSLSCDVRDGNCVSARVY